MKRWNIPVPEALDQKLQKYIQSGKSQFKTKSEFIRDAVRKRLEEII